MSDDADLLRQYLQSHDEGAFRSLVEQRIGFVYAVALRRLGNCHEAEDVTQTVFIALVKKGAQVLGGASIAGWLHSCCCFECRNLLRSRGNRLSRETEAERRGVLEAAPPDRVEARELQSVLDESLNELSPDEREPILAHFFLGRTYSEIGAATGRSEGATRMRVSRALEQLRIRLERRGYVSASALLAGSLPAFASAQIPMGLAPRVTGAALAADAAAPALLFLSMSTSKVIAAVAALAAVTWTGFAIHSNHLLQQEVAALQNSEHQSSLTIQSLRRDLGAMKANAERSAKLLAAGVPSPSRGAKTPPPLRDGVKTVMPPGWHAVGQKPGNYDIGIDSKVTWGGMPSLYIASHPDADNNAFEGVMQSIGIDAYRGQRVQLSGWMKTEDAQDTGSHLWLRVDGADANGNDNQVEFDNMDGRSPTGTTDWQQYSVVLDVPNDATSINYGAFLAGRGSAWVNGVTINTVGTDVPSTNMIKPKQTASVPRRPTQVQPVNLGFAPPPS